MASKIGQKLLDDKERASLSIPVQIHIAELAIALNKKATRHTPAPAPNVVVNGVMAHMRTKAMAQLHNSDILQSWKVSWTKICTTAAVS